MRFLFNLLGGLLLAFALVFAVADISRSIADGTTRLTSLSEGAVATGLRPAAANGAGLSDGGLDLVAALSNWPASIMLGLAALLFLFIGRPARRRPGRLAR